MQNAKYFYALTSRSVEDEVILKSSNRHDARALQVLAPKLPDTAHARQCYELFTRYFQCWHEPRSRLRVVGPDICSDLKGILPSLWTELRRVHIGYVRFDLISFAASSRMRFQAS